MDSIGSDGVEREQVGQPRHGLDGHAPFFDPEKSNFKRALVWHEMPRRALLVRAGMVCVNKSRLAFASHALSLNLRIFGTEIQFI